MSKTALIIIDVQNDFLPGGALAVPGGDEVIAPIERIADLADTVVITQDWHPRGHKSFASSHPDADPFSFISMPYGPQVLWPDHCVQGTDGAELGLPTKVINGASLIIRKGMNPDVDSYSAFMENDKRTPTGLAGWLRDLGIDTVILSGLALDYCVAYSALDAVSAGFKVILPLSASRAISPDTRDEQLTAMRDAGVLIRDEHDDLVSLLGSSGDELMASALAS